jgi:hypothetical protein
MTLFFADGKLHSVAKADCKFCGGCGIALQSVPYVEGEGFTARLGFCNCIEVEIVDKNGNSMNRPSKVV